jgi:hypothetical protein
MSDVPKKQKVGRPRNSCAVGADCKVDDVLLKDIVAQNGSANTVKGASSRLRKSGVPLPFPIEATVSIV